MKNMASGSELDRVIPPEIKNDAFYRLIQQLAAREDVVHILEIGSSAGQGSTAAFTDALRKRKTPGNLYCLEISAPRFDRLQQCYQRDGFVHCHQWSSVAPDGFATEDEVRSFYQTTPSPLNQYPMARVLGWLQQDLDYISQHGIGTGGIDRVKRQYGIEQFDLVLIDGSEFTGRAELEAVYGARYILLDDVTTLKNHANYRRLCRDPQYELVAENKKLRNGYAFFEKRHCPLPVHFFTIVLNGMPFIEYHLEIFKSLKLPWHWHIIEGVADHTHDTAWGKVNGGSIPDECHRHGLSVDGTSDYLDRLAKRHPEKITIYRPPAGKFWDGKLAMVSAPLPNLPPDCLLWQIDADELWTSEQIERMQAMFTSAPDRTAAHFHCHFFVGPELVTVTPNAYSHNTSYEWFRVWRYRQGMRWRSHEPPRLMVQTQGAWRDVAGLHPFTHAETEAAGLVFTHYAYALEHQVRFKERYYGYAGAVDQWRRLQNAARFPARLGDYFAWVRDNTRVDRVGQRRIGRDVAPVPWRFETETHQGEAERPHIVIDGVIFQLQHQRPLGISRVWRNLLPELLDALPEARFTLLERRGFPIPPVAMARHVVAPYKLGDESALDDDDEMLRRTCKSLGADLFISTYFTRAPGFKNLTLVHDLIPEIMHHDLTLPEWRSKSRTLETADAVATVSQCTLDDLKKHYPHMARRPLAVVPNGIGPAFAPVPADRIAAFRRELDQQKPYVLMVGNRHLYKNGAFIFDCMRHPLWDKTLQVLCVGGEGKLTAIERQMAAEGRVRFVPRLDDETLAAAYAGAEAYICLSRYEGFGLPLLEAMACGCPVITTAHGALQETAGNAALYVNGMSPEDVVKAIAEARRPDHRRELIARGVAQVKRFSWAAAARSMTGLIRQVIQQKPVLVSAIVSTYNSERFIRGCLEDLLAQSIANRTEIVVIDSASEQNEGEVVREFQQQYGNIKYIRTPKREPLYAAWNRGIKLAKGKYVTSANTDDRHRLNAFEQMAAVLEEQPRIALVYADVIKTATENETFSKCTPIGVLSWFDWDRQRLLDDGCFMGPQPMWRRSVHDVFGFFDESLTVSSDYEFWLRISQIFDFQRIPKPLGLYLERADSVEHADRGRKKSEDHMINSTYQCSKKSGTVIRFRSFEKLRSGSPSLLREAIDEIRHAIREAGMDAAGEMEERCNELESRLDRNHAGQKDIEQFIESIGRRALFRHADPEGTMEPAGSKTVTHNISTPQGGAPMQLADKIRQGIDLLLKNGHQETVQWMLDKALFDFPQDAGFNHEKAMLCHGQGDMARAAELFQRAAELAPTDPLAQKSLGDFLHAVQGQTEKAIEQYLKVLRLNPGELDTLLTVAHLYVSLRHFDNARYYYEKVLAIDPGHAEAREILARLNQELEKQAAVRNPETLYQQARGQLENGQRGAAVQSLEALVARFPEFATAHNDLGVLHFENGEKEKALFHYEKAAELEPENTTYLKNLADFYYVERSDAEKALKINVQVLSLDPRDIEALMSTGHICMSIGQHEDSRIFFSRVLEIDPQHNEANLLLRQLEAPQAVTQPSPQSAPTADEDLYLKAQDKASAGDVPGAIHAMQQLITREPDNAMAHNDLGVLYYNQGNMEEAQRYYEQAIRLDMHNPTIQKNLADFYFVEQGRIQEALTIYVNILKNDREDIDALMASGTICCALEKDDDARVFFERVLEIDPWHDRAREELDRIDNAPEQPFGESIAAFGQKMAL